MDIINSFRNILKNEGEAILILINQIADDNILRAVDMLDRASGKVICIGVGKSGLIARKIAATMTSVCIPAIYMHASDALHGDIGNVAHGDVIILLSNSGETDEITALLPQIRKREVAIIAIVGNLNSTLAKNSDIILDATIKQEAGTLGIAPTTSTTVALAIGDALALAVAEKKGLNKEGFAMNHPSGRLGRRLTLQVRDLMHGGEQNPLIGPDERFMTVVERLSASGLGAINVVDEQHKLLGIITDGDLKRILRKTQPEKLNTLDANDIMTVDPVRVYVEELAYNALQLMEKRSSQISVLPVVDGDNNCLGLLRLHDIVKAGL